MEDSNMNPDIRLLLVEDNADESDLLQELLKTMDEEQPQFDCTWCPRLSLALTAARSRPFDAVLLDLSLPDSHGLPTFQHLHGAIPSLPVIVLTGLADEELALQAVREGAQDYVVKGDMAPRLLVRAIRYAIERQRLLRKLEEAQKRIDRLGRLLPICAWCKKVRNDQDYWQQVEEYLREQADINFTHGMCPDCHRRYLPQLAPGILENDH
jgi:DNA-binding response OmpR family regulator